MTREELIKSVGCNPNLANEWIENTYAKYFHHINGKHRVFDKFVLAFINNQRLNTTFSDEEIRKQIEPLALLSEIFDKASEVVALLNEPNEELLEIMAIEVNEE
jgi:competence transcription factor ComK